MDIGKRIKELRKRKGMTQEQLAAGLNISFQSVSKWETGLTMPDLTMIPGLTRLLDVTADDLLGLSGKAADERQEFFDKHYADSVQRPYDAEDLSLARQAVAEYPGSSRYLYWLASSEFFDAFENRMNKGGPNTFRNGMEQSLQHALAVWDTADEEKLRIGALSLIIQALVFLDRRAEAKEYAQLYPRGLTVSKEDMLILCAEGDEELTLQQEQLKASTLELLQKLLNFWRSKDLHDNSVQAALSAADSLIHAVIPDGRFLEFHNVLYHISAARAVLAGFDGKTPEMFRALRTAKEHAAAFGALFGSGEHRYTSPLFDRCKVDYPSLAPQVLPPEQEFRELLRKNTFDPYRNSAEFAAISGTTKARL